MIVTKRITITQQFHALWTWNSSNIALSDMADFHVPTNPDWFLVIQQAGNLYLLWQRLWSSTEVNYENANKITATILCSLYVGSFPVLSSRVSTGPRFHASDTRCVSALNSHLNRDPLCRKRGGYCSWWYFDQIILSEDRIVRGYDKTGCVCGFRFMVVV